MHWRKYVVYEQTILLYFFNENVRIGKNIWLKLAPKNVSYEQWAFFQEIHLWCPWAVNPFFEAILTNTYVTRPGGNLYLRIFSRIVQLLLRNNIERVTSYTFICNSVGGLSYMVATVYNHSFSESLDTMLTYFQKLNTIVN